MSATTFSRSGLRPSRTVPQIARDLLDELGVLAGEQLPHLIDVEGTGRNLLRGDGLHKLLAPRRSLRQQFERLAAASPVPSSDIVGQDTARRPLVIELGQATASTWPRKSSDAFAVAQDGRGRSSSVVVVSRDQRIERFEPSSLRG